MNPEHLSIVTKGVEFLNNWRHQHVGERLNLISAPLVLQRQFIWQGGFRDQFEPDNVLP